MSINHNPEEQSPLNGGQSAGLDSAVTTGTPKGAGASSTLMAVFATDLSGEFTGCSAAFAQLLGYAPQEVLGRSFSALFAPAENTNREDQSRMQRSVLTGASAQGEYQARLFAFPKAGGSLPVQFSATVLRNAASAPTSLVAVITPLAKSAVAQSDSTGVAPGITSRKIDGTLFILASPVMHRFMGLVDRVAEHTETALITGETGTGKELIARTIHESSNRRSSSLD